MAMARTTCAITIMSAAVQPLVPQGDSRFRARRSITQALSCPSPPLLKCLASGNGVGRVRFLSQTVGSLGLRATATSSESASAAEDVKPRGRPKKSHVDKQTAAGGNGAATVGEEALVESGERPAHPFHGERPAHPFQYPNGASEAAVLEYDDSTQIADGLAQYVAQLSKEAVERRRVFTIVFSGASIVKALDVMTRDYYRPKIHWRQWHVFWVHERVVPLDHEESNYRLAKEFLAKVPIYPNNIHVIQEVQDASTAASEYEHTLRKLVQRKVLQTDSSGHPRFDLILLGLGPDGHIASLFPNSPQLAEKNRWVAPVTNAPVPSPARITMTLPLINAAAHVSFLVQGRSKAFALQRVLERPALPGSLPAQLVRLSDGELLWHCDKDATSSLAKKDWGDSKKFPYIDYSSSAK